MSKVSQQLKELLEYSNKYEMKINKGKTNIMLFNTAIERDFLPTMEIEGEHFYLKMV